MHLFKKRGDPPHSPPRTATILQGLADRRISNSSAALADLFEQARHDTTGRMFLRMMRDGELTQSFWTMRVIGESWRSDVGHALYHDGGKLGVWPNPRSDLAYSNTKLIEKACKMEGIQRVQMHEDVRQYAQQRTSVPVLVALWTFGSESRPQLYVDYQAPPRSTPDEIMDRTKAWRFQAAQVLGEFIISRPRYVGALVPPDMIVPADLDHNRAWAALMHEFAKGFLYLSQWCAPGFGCMCNDLVRGAAQAPAGHPENTDFLNARDLRGPAGERARRAAQLTPPPSQGPLYPPLASRPPARPTRPIEHQLPRSPAAPPASMPSIPDFAELGLTDQDQEDDGTADLDPTYRTSYKMPSVPKPPPRADLDDTTRLDRAK